MHGKLKLGGYRVKVPSLGYVCDSHLGGLAAADVIEQWMPCKIREQGLMSQFKWCTVWQKNQGMWDHEKTMTELKDPLSAVERTLCLFHAVE